MIKILKRPWVQVGIILLLLFGGQAAWIVYNNGMPSLREMLIFKD